MLWKSLKLLCLKASILSSFSIILSNWVEKLCSSLGLFPDKTFLPSLRLVDFELRIAAWRTLNCSWTSVNLESIDTLDNHIWARVCKTNLKIKKSPVSYPKNFLSVSVYTIIKPLQYSKLKFTWSSENLSNASSFDDWRVPRNLASNEWIVCFLNG